MMSNPYTADDAGCYVDGARGIYSSDAVVVFAEDHGMPKADATIPSIDLEDDADEYMNDHYPVDGYFWGRNENGDWGLWNTEEWS